MPQFTVNASRLDPYKNFKFRVIWDGRVVAGMSYVSALVRTTDVVTFRNGGDPSSVRRMPGQTQFEPLTLERSMARQGPAGRCGTDRRPREARACAGAARRALTGRMSGRNPRASRLYIVIRDD